jgi:hypothetical protein
MRINSVFPSKYVKAADLEGKSTLWTISHIEMETMGFGEDKKTLPVLYFDEVDRGLVLNRTNANTIVDAYGDESDDWAGKPIVLVPTPVQYAGKVTEGIRVRLPKATDKPAAKGFGKEALDDGIPF